MTRCSFVLLLVLAMAPALRAQDAAPVIALVIADEGDDTGRSCFWPLEGTSGLCYLEALQADPVATCLWTAGMVGVATAFLYLSDTICGTPNVRSRASVGDLAEPSDISEQPDVIVRASAIAGNGVGASEDRSLYRVEAFDVRTGALRPLDALGSLHATVRQRDLPVMLDRLRTP